MIRVDIETIIMASGPMPSTVVLRERSTSSKSAPARSLSIQTGSVEAASISQGVHNKQISRPITHDLFINTLSALHVKLERVEIVRVAAPIFYAQLVLLVPQTDSDRDTTEHEVTVDARPSDALALAVRANAPIYVEDDIMNRLGVMSFDQGDNNSAEELEQFDRFVQNLSPDDF